MSYKIIYLNLNIINKNKRSVHILFNIIDNLMHMNANKS